MGKKVVFYEDCGEVRGRLPAEVRKAVLEEVKWLPLPRCGEPIDLLEEGTLYSPLLWVEGLTPYLAGEWRGRWGEFLYLFGGGISIPEKVERAGDEIFARLEEGEVSPSEATNLFRKLAEEVDDWILEEALASAFLEDDGEIIVPVVFEIDTYRPRVGELTLWAVGEEARSTIEEVEHLAKNLPETTIEEAYGED